MKEDRLVVRELFAPIQQGYVMPFQLHRIPLGAKLAITAFVAILVPVYLRTYGPSNFLWFCDAALLLTVAGMWLENALLISMCAVGILIPQCLWLIDFAINMFGIHFLNLTAYMFNHQLSLFIRCLSLFHGWLPLLLIWLLRRVGYDRRALTAWTIFAAALVIICYLFTPPAGAHLANPNTPIDINYIYGFNDQQPQKWINQDLYVILWVAALWLGAYFPTHLILRRFFDTAKPVMHRKLAIRLI